MKRDWKFKNIFRMAIGFLSLGALLTGCGGGGGATVGTSSGDSAVPPAKTVLYVTDSFREDYDHVWATIYHVDLVAQSGELVALFDSADGVLIDLKTLRDSAGERFSFLGGATIPQGTYTGADVTIGPTMELFKAGSTTGETVTVESSTTNNGNPIIDVTFRYPKTIGSGTNTVIVDFDLANFRFISNSIIRAALQEGDPTHLGDSQRHNPDDYRGIVSALSGTSPELTFSLDRGDGKPITVTTSASTALYGLSSLENGSRVIVSGTFDSTTNFMLAERVNVLPVVTSELSAGVFGTASDLNAAAGTFTVTITRAHGFIPAQTSVKVVTNEDTKFFGDGGGDLTQADFFTASSTTSGVSVEGKYDASTQTLTAKMAKVTDKALMTPKWNEGTPKFRANMSLDNWGHGVFMKR